MAAEREEESIEALLKRVKAGDKAALNDFLTRVNNTITERVRAIRRRNPLVARYDQTGDIAQDVNIRLLQAIERGVIPETEAGFHALLGRHIRFALIDLARHYRRSDGTAANHYTPARDDSRVAPIDVPASGTSPGTLEKFEEFHQAIENLDEKHRVMFDLLWYQDKGRSEAAKILGITESAVGYRWVKARLALDEALGPDFSFETS